MPSKPGIMGNRPAIPTLRSPRRRPNVQSQPTIHKKNLQDWQDGSAGWGPQFDPWNPHNERKKKFPRVVLWALYMYTWCVPTYQPNKPFFFFFKNLWDGSIGKDACCQSPEPMGEGEMWLLQVVLTPPHACFSTCLPTNTHTHGQINKNNFLMQRKNPVGAGLRHKEKRAGWSSGEC